jgi:Cation/multidrug efflux pump
MGASATNESETDELVTLVNSVVQGFPDTIAFAKKSSLFRSFGSGRTIDINIQSKDLITLMKVALQSFINTTAVYPNIRPRPGLELAQPEIRLIPNERRIVEVGWNRSDVASLTQTLGDGKFVGDYFNGEETLDVILRSLPWDTPESLASIPVVVPGDRVLPLNEIVNIVRTVGPEQIRRLNRRRTVTLEVSPPPNIPLEEAMVVLKNEVEPKIMEQLPSDGDIFYTGTADKLTTKIINMTGSFLLAIKMLYLLMSAIIAL